MKTPAKNARILTTAAQIREATKTARERNRTTTKIVAARYDGTRDRIDAELSTGSTLTVPRARIPAYAAAAPAALADLAITPGGSGLWSDTVDDGVLLEQLLVFAAGETILGTLGARLNAAKKSPARARASRENGAKGGRPKTSAA